MQRILLNLIHSALEFLGENHLKYSKKTSVRVNVSASRHYCRDALILHINQLVTLSPPHDTIQNSFEFIKDTSLLNDHQSNSYPNSLKRSGEH